MKLIEPYVTKFYGVTPARVNFLKKIYKIPSQKCELLVMGADDEKVIESEKPEVKKIIRGKYNINDDDFLIMTGGKIDTWKKQTLLLMEAVAKIDNPKVKLIVFGSVTPDLNEKVKSLCMPNKIQYIGWIKSEESYKYFASADLVVFPGRHSVFWEQVAGQGIPMVCKYWEGTTHVDIGGNVEFIKEDSIEEINNIITSIIEDADKYTKMREQANLTAKGEFSYMKIADKSISTT